MVLYPLKCCTIFPQNGREDPLLTNALMTPPRSSTFLDTSLHKDVFGVISGTCECNNDSEKWRKKITVFCFCLCKALFAPQLRLMLHQLPTSTPCATLTPAARLSAPTLATVCLRRTMTRSTLWTRYRSESATPRLQNYAGEIKFGLPERHIRDPRLMSEVLPKRSPC